MKKLFISALFTIISISNAWAVDVDARTQVVASIAPSEVNYNQVNKNLADIESNLRSGHITSGDMNGYIKELTIAQDNVSEAKKQIEKDLSFVQKRIEALGEEPKEGEKEPDVIAKKRQEFNEEASSLRTRMAEADIVIAKTDELETLILNTRNKELFDNLLDKQELMIYPNNFLISTAKFVEFFFDIVHSPIDWYKGLKKSEKKEVQDNIIPVILSILASLWVAIYLRGFIKHKLGYRKDIEAPRYATKVFAAVFVAIAYGAIPAAILGAFIVWIKNTPIMNQGFFSLVLISALFYLLYIFLGRAIVRVIFAPYNEKWRLFNIKTERAKKITSALYLTVLLLGSVSYLFVVAKEANYSLELLNYVRLLSNAVKAVCIIHITRRCLLEIREVKDESEETEEDYEINAELEEEEGEFGFALKVTFLLSLFAVVSFSLSLFGYPNLSSFILNRFILSVMIIGGFLIIRKATTEIFHRLLLLRFWTKTMKLGRRQINKVDFWFMLIIDPIVFIFASFSLLSLWGVSTDILLQSIKKLFFGFEVGGVKISLAAIMLGIAVFFVSIALVRAARGRLLSNVLDKTEMEDGIKHSLASGFGFFGFIISALLAITVMGGSLTNLALIAGALSFGVGLGLQNIVNNCVSGIILLFERPLKIGDWVIINGQEGIVKQINIRATELETWTKASIIIPNADILSSNVMNMTHQDKWGRIDVKVGAGYGSNTDQIKKILMEIIEGNKRILKKPAPYVVFTEFGENSINFEVRGWTTDVTNKLTISSEIRTEIYNRFGEAGIDIPVPQRVIHNAKQYTTFPPKDKK